MNCYFSFLRFSSISNSCNLDFSCVTVFSIKSNINFDESNVVLEDLDYCDLFREIFKPCRF